MFHHHPSTFQINSKVTLAISPRIGFACILSGFSHFLTYELDILPTIPSASHAPTCQDSIPTASTDTMCFLRTQPFHSVFQTFFQQKSSFGFDCSPPRPCHFVSPLLPWNGTAYLKAAQIISQHNFTSVASANSAPQLCSLFRFFVAFASAAFACLSSHACLSLFFAPVSNEPCLTLPHFSSLHKSAAPGLSPQSLHFSELEKLASCP